VFLLAILGLNVEIPSSNDLKLGNEKANTM